MTANCNPDDGAPPPSDIFDMERPPLVPVVPEPSEPARPASSTISGALKAARPMHFGIAGVAAVAIWVGWPYAFPDGAITAQPASRLMLPATAPALVNPAVPLPMIAEAVQVVPAPELQVALPPVLPSLAQPAPLPALPVQPRRVHTKVQHKSTPAELAGPASAQFTINTVYAGQAWIQDNERTYVVQPGDKVKGIRIVSIDVPGRRILTSHGVIR